MNDNMHSREPVQTRGPALTHLDEQLRWKAEKVVCETPLLSLDVIHEMSPEDTQLLFHELRVHQIELEMQNEELRRQQLELDASRAIYFDLYDLAPIGYCTLNEQGLIVQTNFTAAALLGVMRGTLILQPFTNFILSDDQDIYYLHRRRAGDSDEPRSCELRMVKRDGTQFWAHLLTSTAIAAGQTKLRVVISDISERKQAELQLLAGKKLAFESARHNQIVLDNIVDGVITITERGLLESFNQAASDMFGYAAEEVLGRNIAMLMPEPHRSHHDEYLQHFHRTAEARVVGVRREVEGRRQDGSLFPMSLSVSKVTSFGKTIFIGIVRDITQRRQDEEEIRLLAFYDPLTGLPNRRLLMDRVKQAMLSSERTGQHGAVMFLDLDHFKQLNDTRGHDVGDVLLQQVAQRLQTCLRESDSAARLGGDEFVLLLEGLSLYDHEAAAQAESVAHKILLTLGQPYDLRGQSHNSTPSIGIAVYLQDHESIEDVLKKADVAMYQAKAAGRNTVRFFDPVMQAAVAAHTELETDMRRALVQHEFVMHYQVQVDITGKTTGTEALVRWKHPQQGMVLPASFIPLAEETGMILPLGQWVLETACTQLSLWASQPGRAQWTMAVNVSALQFSQTDFVTTVAAALKKTSANPCLLKLELTESMLVKDLDDIIAKMNTIRALGVSFSLDDFGTGYSSLSHLKRLPMNQIKIDQSFVRELLTDPNDAVIARTIVALGHSLGLTVMAEGVETVDQRDLLAHMGCDAFQGYYFGDPVSASGLPNGLH